MSIEFIDGEPPTRTDRIDWTLIAAKLEANAGSWAIIDIGRSGTKLRTIAYNINKHNEGAAARVRHNFDAVVRDHKLYMRYSEITCATDDLEVGDK